jgi:hypothetical protein
MREYDELSHSDRAAASAKRQPFDAWYAREHMPDAVKSFGAEKAAVLEPQRSCRASGGVSVS